MSRHQWHSKGTQMLRGWSFQWDGPSQKELWAQKLEPTHSHRRPLTLMQIFFGNHQVFPEAAPPRVTSGRSCSCLACCSRSSGSLPRPMRCYPSRPCTFWLDCWYRTINIHPAVSPQRCSLVLRSMWTLPMHSTTSISFKDILIIIIIIIIISKPMKFFMFFNYFNFF